MALKNLFDMVKADRYTADGREAIIKAQEAETEDARPTNGIYHWKSGDYRKEGDKYVKIGPGTGGAGKTPQKQNPTRSYSFEVGSNGMPKPGTGKQVQSFKTKKEAQEALKKQNTAESKPVDKEKLLDTLSFDLVDTTADIEEEYNAVERSDNSRLPEFVRQEIERDYVNKTNGEKWTDEEKDIIAEEVTRRIKERQSKSKPSESKPAAASDIPDFKGMTSEDFDKKLRSEGWTTGGWEGSGTHSSAIFKKGDRTIRVNEGQPGKITSIQEISKPAVEKFDIEKWKTGPKVEKNSKLDWSHGVVGESIPVQEKSAEEKRNLINKYNSVGRLSRIGTKKKSYYNNKYGTFEVAGIDNDNVYIQEERSNGMGSKYMVLVTIPLNEVEEINPFHDYGKRNPDTGEESPTRPPLPEDAAPRVLTGDTRIRVRKA